MGFGEAGAALGGAYETYEKQKRVRDFVARQLAKLPPEKQLEAQAILTAPQQAEPMPQPMPAAGMGGMPDSTVPPEVYGQQQAPVNDLFAAPAAPEAAAPAKADPGTESLRMLLEATRDDVMEPKGLFDYIAGMGKQDMVGSNRMEIEHLKESLQRDLKEQDMQSRLDRLERVLENRKQLNDDDNATSTDNNKRTNTTRLTATDRTNSTRKEIAHERPAGKGGKDPDAMTQDEIDAELGIYESRADSLSTAGGDPKAVGYKPAEEKFATIDESNRQKDLSKALDRVTALKAAKARKQVGPGGATAPGAPPPASGGGKVYSSKAEVRADIAKGLIGKGQRIMMMLNGQQVQTVPVK